MPHTYKLTYFNVRGRAEPARLMFAAGKHKYVDRRIDFLDWPEEKKKTPQGSLPVLVIDDNTTVCQSLAINRYLAKKFSLYSDDSLEALYIDEIVETTVPLLEKGAMAQICTDKIKKKELLATFMNETAPTILGQLESSLSQRGGKHGFAVGSKLSVADIVLFCTLETAHLEGVLDKYPRVKASSAKVPENKHIAEWLKKRP